MYANIIVNISHENLDKSFQYIVPKRLEEIIHVGDQVSIPFGKGNRLINGYVLMLTEKLEFDPNKQKEIVDIITDSSLVEGKLIKLAYWMKEEYGSTMINALKTVLPVKKNVKPKEQKTVVLKIGREEGFDRLREYKQKHQTARFRLMEQLLDMQELDYSLVINKLNISSATIKVLSEQGVIDVEARRVYRGAVGGAASGTTADGNSAAGTVTDKIKPQLNEKQREIADSLIADYNTGLYNSRSANNAQPATPVSLIRGITGSGKTEIYMEVIEEVVRSGRQAIVLIPEISLTYQTVLRFYKRFGDRVSTLHSKLSEGERYDQFEKAKNGEIDVMIGPRSALFTPFSNLGLIVIDEEHESTYKSDNMPKYHAREVAIKLAELHGAMVVLGSATPSVISYYEALKGNYKLYGLDVRAKQAILPKAYITDLRDELKQGNRSIFSRRLKEGIADRLEKGEQTMLFLNRRGYAGFISCRSCGHVVKCPHCDVSLSEHFGGARADGQAVSRNLRAGSRLVCHYCGYEQNQVTECPECHSKMIGGMRAGTEKIEQEIKKMFPQARVLRMDADTTRQKDGYEKILSSFANREADILVGTQMIVKGHDFPYVTLVGILAADMSLYAADYRAGERTFQLLTQAAGRAGRGEIEGEVIIQTYNPDNYCILSAAEQDYEQFYKEEIAYRQLLGYPPCAHLLAILIEGKDEKTCELYSEDLAEVVGNGIMGSVIGPTDAQIRKIEDVFRRVVYIKSPQMSELVKIKDKAEAYVDSRGVKGIRVTFDFDPEYGY